MSQVLTGFLTGIGMLATSVQVFTGVALTLCKSEAHTNTTAFTFPGALQKPGPALSTHVKVGLFVFVPVLLFPVLGLLAQATCPWALAKNCDTRCFVIVFTAVPAGVMQALTVATANCLFDADSALAAIYASACATTFVSFSLLTWTRAARLRRDIEDMDNDNKGVAFI